MTAQVAAVILAAGKGTRMKSAQPKVLHPLCGRPLVAWPLAAVRELGCQPAVLVVGHGAEAVRQATAGDGVRHVLQQPQLGTGHALLCAREALADFAGTVLLLAGDVPLLRAETLQRLAARHQQARAAATVLTMTPDNPFGYGRIVRDGGRIARIVEQKDATPAEAALNEVNTGVYAFDAGFVFAALERVGTANAQGEYYLTDVVELAVRSGEVVETVQLDDPEEALGVNDRRQLADLAGRQRRRINDALMLAGVTLIDPAACYIDAGVEIGVDSVIHPGVHLRGATRLGQGVTVEPGAIVTDCAIGDGCIIKAGSVLEQAEVGAGSQVGPMAHLRPGTVLAGDNRIGNFVETKKAVIGRGSKASHLTYLGDCELGSGVNIGCGTITCNYDGVNKHRTVIGAGVFIGSDVQLVAPVTVGDGALVAAGTTVTADVPADALAISRTPQKNIDGWVPRWRQKLKKK